MKRHFPATKRFKELEANLGRWLGAVRGRGKAEDKAPPVAVDDDEARAQIVEALADDVRRLRSFLGPDFDGWGIA